MLSNRLQYSVLLCLSISASTLLAQNSPIAASNGSEDSQLGGTFDETIEPVLETSCLDCHGGDEPEAMLDLSGFRSAGDVIRSFETWNLVLRRVADQEMPPEDSGYALGSQQRTEFVEWIEGLQAEYAARNAGDPGDVLARRLNSTEYNHSIRDLTGVDIQPAKHFPVDPSNAAGFSNSGESLAMTPALLNKYLEAARTVSEHLLLTPDGIDFSPHPVVTETDRDKYCVRRIIDFYQHQNTELADYFYAAYKLTRTTGSEHPQEFSEKTIEQVANRSELSVKYLSALVELLYGRDNDLGPIRQLRRMFSALPEDLNAAWEGCRDMRDYVQEIRQQLGFDFPHLNVSGMNRGSQTLVLWRNRQKATHRMKLNEAVLLGEAVLHSDQPESEGGEPEYPELVLPQKSEERQASLTALRLFCRIFPDAFYIDRRGREYLDANRKRSTEKDVRLLSAGFHSMMGYFRDDQPLYELLLNEKEQQQLDQLWFELDFIADAPARQHAGFIWFERAEGRYLVDEEFDPFRSEDKNAASQPMIRALAELYIAKARRLEAGDLALQAIEEHFERTDANIRRVERAWEVARPLQIAALIDFAQRAYRRPLSPQECRETRDFYSRLVERDGLRHEDAMRDSIVAILMSPHFCYRLHESHTVEPAHPLSDYALASRLSYFLWSSMPDDELMNAAAEGVLREPEQLKAQVTRMLRDPKARGLAVEFAGNWLGFRQFETHNSVDRNRFPQFDDALRGAMFEEPVRFTLDVLQNDRSVLDFLYANHTFVNPVLARHYGIEEISSEDREADAWWKLESAHEVGRGGVLPMAVFMTSNSPGLRTSPVKRGYWVIRQLLGELIPAPPPNVPELPNDESQLGDLTLRQVLEQHRQHPSCAGCHEKFDSVGLVFEGYGPIGELREVDLAGNPVDTSAELPDGSKRVGLKGLLEYLKQQRQEDFVDTLSRKLLAYALSRSLIISDEPLLNSIKEQFSASDYRIQPMIHKIVTSPQFLNQRGRSFHPSSEGEMTNATP